MRRGRTGAVPGFHVLTHLLADLFGLLVPAQRLVVRGQAIQEIQRLVTPGAELGFHPWQRLLPELQRVLVATMSEVTPRQVCHAEYRLRVLRSKLVFVE